MNLFILLVFSYLLGSVSFGFLIVLAIKKEDIRNLGSGNIGATNVTRVLGKNWGRLVFFLDFLKGFLPVLLVGFFDLYFFINYSYWVYIFSALLSVCGHNWPIFLNFKGGKGVSTSIGAIIGLCLVYPPLLLSVLVAVISWIILFFITKTVSIASLVSSLFFMAVALMTVVLEFKVLSVVLFVLILVRHKQNIYNLLHKKERSF